MKNLEKKTLSDFIGALYAHTRKFYSSNYIVRKLELKNDDVDNYFKEFFNIILYDFRDLISRDEIVNALINRKSVFAQAKNYDFYQIYNELLKMCSAGDSKYFDEFCSIHCEHLAIKYAFIFNLVYFHILHRVEHYTTLPDKIFERTENDAFVDNNNQFEYFFRGQCNYAWGLVPSFCRNIKANSCLITNSILDSEYKKSKNIQKYNEVYGNYTLNYYSFLAYMQHSISYSPLLDFTESPDVALSFALQSSPLDFYKTDASLYCLKVNKSNIFDDTNLSKLNALLQDYKFFRIVKGTTVQTIIKNIVWLNYMSIGKYHPIEMYVIRIRSNDRMKYQKGVFVFFNNFIMVGDKLVFTDSLISQFHKLRIPASTKGNLRMDSLGKWYEYRFLMDPYLYFTEPIN